MFTHGLRSFYSSLTNKKWRLKALAPSWGCRLNVALCALQLTELFAQNGRLYLMEPTQDLETGIREFEAGIQFQQKVFLQLKKNFMRIVVCSVIYATVRVLHPMYAEHAGHQRTRMATAIHTRKYRNAHSHLCWQYTPRSPASFNK